MEKRTINQKIGLDYKASEAFKTLRTNLENSNKDARVLTFTSVMGREGKSFVAFYTAMAMAASGKRCVYVNGNLREKEHNPIFTTDSSNGLTEYLAGKNKAEDILYETNINNLYVIEAGSSTNSAAELLSGEGFDNLVTQLKKTYDYVVIDTPAIGEVADGLIMAHNSDGVILVMEPELVPYEQAQKIKGLLEVNGCKLLGVVMNKEQA